MTSQGPSQQATGLSARQAAWATGLALFAGTLMVVAGVYHALAGIAALINDEVYVSTPDYVYAFDITGWGWTHLVLGILVAAVGVAVLQGYPWGRMAGIALAALSLVANFLFLPYYPIWSLLIIALDIAIIWALSVLQRERV